MKLKCNVLKKETCEEIRTMNVETQGLQREEGAENTKVVIQILYFSLFLKTWEFELIYKEKHQ